jgi:DNA (cytosine-5)-methyltransferase 1
MDAKPRAAEFFAGIGLVRAALEESGWRVVWANDIEPFKHAIYQANFDDEHFVLGDIRDVHGCDIPDIELATASFPCTDLSLAGNQRGLDGHQSGMFWEFTRILEEMGERRPQLVLLENVPAFVTSKGGADFEAAMLRLRQLGYRCSVTVADSRSFVPQSRQRVFVIGSRRGTTPLSSAMLPGFESVPPTGGVRWVQRLVGRHSTLDLTAFDFGAPVGKHALADVVEHIARSDASWWDAGRVDRFIQSLAPHQARRLEEMRLTRHSVWATAYRRTRQGRATWEIRSDSISGCLRTARGGSSRQALVEAGWGSVRVRWMTSREYARLQGAPDFAIPPTVSENQALSGFGDAVTLPVVKWLSERHLSPLISLA